MQTTMNRRAPLGTLGSILVTAAGVRAQSIPAKPIDVLVGGATGGAVDREAKIRPD